MAINVGDTNVFWGFPIVEKDPLFIPVEDSKKEPDTMAVVDEITANEIRSQSLQDFSKHGRGHDTVLLELESTSVFSTNLLKMTAIDNHREIGSLESVANKKILGE